MTTDERIMETAVGEAQLEHDALYIGGRWRAARSHAKFLAVNPDTEEQRQIRCLGAGRRVQSQWNRPRRRPGRSRGVLRDQSDRASDMTSPLPSESSSAPLSAKTHGAAVATEKGPFMTQPLAIGIAASCVGVMLTVGVSSALPIARADNKRLNNDVVANVYTVQHQAGCTNDVKINPQLRLAAERHTEDVMNNRALDSDTGSDGSTAQDRAAAAGFHGTVAETVAINPALAISGVEILQQWYYNPADLAIMQNCAYTTMGVWSENSLDRTVVVAVYGHPA
jgi:uncharacterized protein YkwD